MNKSSNINIFTALLVGRKLEENIKLKNKENIGDLWTFRKPLATPIYQYSLKYNNIHKNTFYHSSIGALNILVK